MANSYLRDIAHKDTAERNAENQKQREIIRCQRNIFSRSNKKSAQKQVADRSDQHKAGNVNIRQAEFECRINDFHAEETVDIFDQLNQKGHRLDKKSQMAKQHGQQGVMESQSADPQKNFQLISQAARFFQLHAGVAEQGPKS